MSLIAELKRRNVIRMAGLYLVGAWLLVQVAGTVLPWFAVSASVLRGLVVVLAIGFVPALVFAWVFELTPDGIKRDADVPIDNSIAPQTAGRMDRLIIVVLLMALGYFGVDKFLLAPQREAAQLAVAKAARAHAAAALTPAAGRQSIAVLPFVNMSADPENEFFSDGLSEEILNSLARIDGMQVVGRTSSFQFKGKSEDLGTIGLKLGVATVLEGSVRREGDRARITAQLIRTADGIQLWSQTYDRTMKDSLAVQLDIAEKVADVLDVVLDDKQRARMRQAGVKDVEAFIAYQKGVKLYDQAHNADRSRSLLDTLRLANVQFARASALDPSFAEPHYAAADLYEHLMLADASSVGQREEAGRLALRELGLAAAASRDPQQRLFIEIDRQILSEDWHGLAAHIDAALLSRGCAEPDWLPQFAVVFGYGARFEPLGRRLSACDPLNLSIYARRAEAANWAGHPQQALAIVADAEETMGGASALTLQRVRALVALSRFDEARAALAALNGTNEVSAMMIALIDGATGEPQAARDAHLRAFDRKQTLFDAWAQADAVAAAQSGDTATVNRLAAAADARPGGGLWLVLLLNLCQCGAPFDLDATPRFKARLAESGLRWPPPETIHYPPRAKPATP